MPEYKERLFLNHYFGDRIFRYRYDPVPNIPRFRCLWSYFRNMRSSNEKRQAFEHKELIRAKRNFKNLPNPWDLEKYATILHIRNWKRTKKKKQWL
jgi:hypothetical protein